MIHLRLFWSTASRRWASSRSLVQSTRTRRCFQASASFSTTTTTTHFGFEAVPVSEKEGRVKKVFETVADSYDVMNDLMSAGLHRAWKDYLVQVSAVAALAQRTRQMAGSAGQERPTLRILDVAGGTGDVAFRFVDQADCLERSKSSGEDPVSITVCDINQEMLRVGQNRARQRYGSDLLDKSRALQFVQGNAEHLDFADQSFDIYTIAFGLRNVTHVDQALNDAWRVLKPGGRFLCLEFSHVPNDWLRQIYDAYSFHVIPTMGEVVARDRGSYQYLVESIRRFPRQDELVARMEQAGFVECRYTNLSGGIVALHEGYRPL